MTECEFLFAALAEKHNAVIRRMAHTLASALAVYRLSSRRPTTLSEEERAVQPMGSFRNCLEGVSFRLRYGGREVSPDSMITCPKCHKRFRVGKKQG